ncbi:UNVERIFIED_CONTAM: hypothetical protein BJ099_13032 [Lysinibacillus xylanilyticus]
MSLLEQLHVALRVQKSDVLMRLGPHQRRASPGMKFAVKYIYW